MKIQMCDLLGQYRKIQPEVDEAMSQVINGSAFINGPQVREFKTNLERYTGAKHVIPCGNGTDALQITLNCLLSRKQTRTLNLSRRYKANHTTGR